MSEYLLFIFIKIIGIHQIRIKPGTIQFFSAANSQAYPVQQMVTVCFHQQLDAVAAARDRKRPIAT